ncbi:COX15/CtaA family protein [Halobacteria archaeon AArc-m2/3/4]|uniref:COX15/CtaA family protein n=1 Tax=Natronoglomus mannanivorans TaxID=2979990 RepID=A0AAP2YX53_9EURY|nr:COX15/CtaA family protein [Halobacteria archaeon AArc-xg1-1]MCU4971395.1 COX15/CtaA family protein [Halobacteria archaeon AArc-m2/3/4]
MSYDSHTSDSSSASPFDRFDRFGFSHLLASTVVLVAATILLGVAAKATGSGLACDANWPLCDGGLLNLFPANFPSFFEWIHRVVAMVAGFFIVGTAIVAWRAKTIDRRITYAVTLGLILTPIQVTLGRETVLSYEMTILSLHFWTAVVIFALFVVSAILVWAHRLTTTHVTLALAVGAVSVPLHVALSPLFIDSYTAVIQTAQYAAVLTLLSAVSLAAIVGWRRYESPLVSSLVAATPVLAVGVLFLGRRAVMTFAPALDVLYALIALVLFVTLLAGMVLTHRAVPATGDALAP